MPLWWLNGSSFSRTDFFGPSRIPNQFLRSSLASQTLAPNNLDNSLFLFSCFFKKSYLREREHE